MDKFRQVLVKDGEIFSLKICRPEAMREREKLQLNGWEGVF